MDTARASSNPISLIPTAILLFFFGIATLAGAQTSGTSSVDQAKKLSGEQRWQEVVRLLQSAPNPSADLDFYYGTALAQLGRWDDASRAFESGAQLQPGDKRFPLELAGVAFKQKRYSVAARQLRRALHLDPSDSYGNDFLGTVYFLQGNIEAALKYWNRAGKPQIVEVRTQPAPRVNPALLDRAMAFAPASVLRLPDLLTTQVRVSALEIFPRYQFDLQARDDGKFDILFRNRERDGWGDSRPEKLFLLLRGLPFQSITPEVYNLRHQAINFVSMYRWDADKRRVLGQLSGPFKANPKFRYGLLADLRSENWDIRNSFQGPAPVLGSFNMRREAVSANFAALESGRWHWSAGAEISHRDFRSVIAGTTLNPTPVGQGLPTQADDAAGHHALATAGAAIDPRCRCVLASGTALVGTFSFFREAARFVALALAAAIPGRRLRNTAAIQGGQDIWRCAIRRTLYSGIGTRQRSGDARAYRNPGRKEGKRSPGTKLFSIQLGGRQKCLQQRNLYREAGTVS